MNETIIQFFHWYFPKNGNLWRHAAEEAAYLASLGITQVWLPPAYKSMHGADEPGYAVYDLFDLGEFNQKGTVRTKFGSKKEYINCIKELHAHGIRVLADVVLNHKHGADEKENVRIRWVDKDDRNRFISEEKTIEAATKFTFPGRHAKYSSFQWDAQCFTGIEAGEDIGLLHHRYSEGQWDEMLEKERGNFDFLMGNDIEFRNPFVVAELKRWGQWYVETTGVDGFRLDALKHINADFYPDWLSFLKQHFQREFLVIGEYWVHNIQANRLFFERTNNMIPLFDVTLHMNFHKASLKREQYDLRTIFDGTIVKERPDMAITFVDNHDTQPLQALESPVQFWFKPHAAAIILLRDAGLPCVFYPSLYGASYCDKKNGQEVNITLHKVPGLPEMIRIRHQFAYGLQRDYLEDANMIGWTREGDAAHPGGCAVLLSTARDGQQRMAMGQVNANKAYKDVCGVVTESITLDQDGIANFPVRAGKVSVWIDAQKDI